MAVTSDQVVLELQAQTAAHDAALLKSADVYEQSMARIKRAAEGAEGADEDRTRRNIARRLRVAAAVRGEADTVVTQSRLAANATRNLGRQVADVGVGLAGGQNPFLIIAQQAPQVADALADTTGKAAAMARFFAGPWGAALLAAASVAGILIGKLLEGDDAADEMKAGVNRLSFALVDLKARAQEARDAVADLVGEGGKRLQELTQIRVDSAAAEAKAAAKRKQLATIESLSGLSTGDPAADAAAELTRLKQAAKLRQEINSLESDAQSNRVSLRQLEANDNRIRREEQDTIDLRDAKKGEAEARKANAAAKRAERAAAKDDRADTRQLEQLQNKFDPLAASVREFNEALKDIDEALARGAIGEDAAARYRDAANAARIVAAISREALDRPSVAGILERPGGISSRVDLDDKRIADEFEMRQEASNNLRQYNAARDQEEVSNLASFYENAFNGGSMSIWDTFKREGIKAIALLLAKMTVGSTGGLFGGGGLGGLISSGLGSVFGGGFKAPTVNLDSLGQFAFPGRASGGHVSAGKLYGVNERGKTEGFRAAQSGQIVPLGPMAGNGGNGTTQVFQSFVLDNRGGITTKELLAHVNAVAKSAAVQAGAVSYKSAVDASPGRVARLQTLGT